MLWFGRERKRIELQVTIRRIVDLTMSDLTVRANRVEERYGRTLPVLLAPWEHDAPLVDQARFVVTKDISDHGMALIVPEPSEAVEVVVGMWIHTHQLDVVRPEPDPVFMLANVRNCSDIGGGCWQLGLQLEEILKSGRVTAALRPLAQNLLPQSLHRELAPAR